jgi:predicted nucleotidyltransferase
LKRGFRDRDHLRTPEMFYFTTVGNVHPKNRVFSYLKYVPDKSGKWGRRRKYRRAIEAYSTLQIGKSLDFLKRNYPQYVFHSNLHNLIFSAVPKKLITQHYQPERKLQQLLMKHNLDSLEKKTVDLVHILADESNVDLDSFGVTGSVLLGIHRTEFSDIDLTVYGRRSSVAVRDALIRILQDRYSSIKRFSSRRLSQISETEAKIHHLTPLEATRIYQRKWNRGEFQNTFFSLHPVKTECEVSEKYGDRIYLPRAIVTVKAEISDASEAFFMPASYGVRGVKMLQGPKVPNIREIVSYEGLFADIASEGEEVTCQGKLEQVRDRKQGETYNRILVGSIEASESDYIIPKH